VAIKDLFVRLLVENKQFKKGVSEAGDELKTFGKQASDTSKDAGLLGASLERYLGPMALAGTVAKIGQATWQLGELGARADAVGAKLAAFAGSADQAAAFTEAIQEASNRTVDSMTAMATASGFLQMGIADTEDEMRLYVEGAVRLGDQTQSAGQRIEAMTQLLKNQSVEMLDNFGLSRQLIMARTEELQATQALTREQAMLQAIQEELTRQLGVLGPQTQTSAAAFDQLDASVKDLKIAAGDLAAPAVAELARVLTALAQAASGNVQPLNDLAGGWTSLTSAMKFGAPQLINILDTFGLLDDAAKLMGATVVKNIDEVDGWMQAMHGLPEVAADAATGVDMVTRSFDIFNEKLGLFGKVKGMVPAPFLEAMDIIEKEQDRLQSEMIRKAVLRGTEEERAAERATNAWEDAAEAQRRAYEDLKNTIQQALQPTEVTALDTYQAGLGQYVEKWDEAARQLDAIAERGFAEIAAHPEWANILKIPPEILAANEDVLKEWARSVSDAVRDLERPDLLNVDAAVEAVRQELARQAAVEMSLDIVAKAAIEAGVVGGVDARQQVSEALGLTQPLPVNLNLAMGTQANLLQTLDAGNLGMQAGDQLLVGLRAELSTGDAIRTWTVWLNREVTTAYGGFRDVGKHAAEPVKQGFIAGLTDANFLAIIAAAVSPLVAAQMQSDQTYGGEY
jgi:hypothetical protein